MCRCFPRIKIKVLASIQGKDRVCNHQEGCKKSYYEPHEEERVAPAFCAAARAGSKVVGKGGFSHIEMPVGV